MTLHKTGASLHSSQESNSTSCYFSLCVFVRQWSSCVQSWFMQCSRTRISVGEIPSLISFRGLLQWVINCSHSPPQSCLSHYFIHKRLHGELGNFYIQRGGHAAVFLVVSEGAGDHPSLCSKSHFFFFFFCVLLFCQHLRKRKFVPLPLRDNRANAERQASFSYWYWSNAGASASGKSKSWSQLLIVQSGDKSYTDRWIFCSLKYESGLNGSWSNCGLLYQRIQLNAKLLTEYTPKLLILF